MIEFITGLLDAQIDYIGLLTGVAAYIAFMWIAFTVWVFVDAKKKFNSVWKALLLTLFVFPLNIPGFILYLIFRPEHDDFADVSVVDAAGHQHHYGGVQVPLVHFTGDKGEVQMTFGLTLNPKAISAKSPDMNIDVSWDSDSEHMVLKAAPQQVAQKRAEPVVERSVTPSVNRFAGLGEKIKGSISSVAATVSGSISKSSEELSGEESSSNDDSGLITAERASSTETTNTSFSSKKKKKRR